MTYSIQIQKGQLDVEKALKNMDYDVVKFEAELKMFADHQKPKLKKKLLRQYAEYMRGCGFKLDVRGIGKTPCSCSKPTPKIEPIIEIKPETSVKPENKPETTPKTAVAEVAVQVETQKEEVPVPQTDPVLESEKIPKSPKEPQAETAKTNTATSNATAYFTYSDANLFKKLYEAMCVLVGEITWKISKDSLSMRQIDPSNVALIDLTIKKEEFEEYAVETPGSVAFDAGTIKKAVFAKPFQKGTSIGIKIDGVVGRITFIIKDNRTRERSFSTLEAAQENIPTPKISFNAKYKIIGKQLAEDIAELNRLGDHMTIVGTADSLQMKVEGDCSKGETTYKRGDDFLIDIEVREESRAVYSFIYLKDFVHPTLSELVVLEYATDMPLKVTNLTKFGEITFYVAPRISCD